MNLDEAIGKHAEWKVKLRAAIAKKETMDATSISRDDACEVGKWLHGEGRRMFGTLASHGASVAAHATFHREAGRVAEAINAKSFDVATAMLGMASSYTSASTAVGMALMKLKGEARL